MTYFIGNILLQHTNIIRAYIGYNKKLYPFQIFHIVILASVSLVYNYVVIVLLKPEVDSDYLGV